MGTGITIIVEIDATLGEDSALVADAGLTEETGTTGAVPLLVEAEL